MKLKSLFILVILMFTLSGCTTIMDGQESLSFDMASQPAFIANEWVKRMPPMVQVHPASRTSGALSVLFVPFRVTQSMQYADDLGYGIAASVWQNWLADKTFDTIEFSRDATPYRRDLALMLAKQKGADLVVGGFVTHYFAGGTNADSTVAIIIEIHDANNGQLVWSLAQTGTIPKQSYSDFLFFAVKTRLPSDPVYAIVSTMANDMSRLIKNWQGRDSMEKPNILLDRSVPFTGNKAMEKPKYDNDPNANNQSRTNQSF